MSSLESLVAEAGFVTHQQSSPALFDRFLSTTGDAGASQLLSTLGGQSNHDQSFWFFSESEAATADSWLVGPFRDLRESRPLSVGRDWQGRVYAMRSTHPAEVLLADPSTAAFYVAPITLRDFFAEDLGLLRRDCLHLDLYGEWLAQGRQPPDRNTCIAPRQPEFQSGTNTVENLELIDLDVYWTITGQYVAKLLGTAYDFDGRGVAPG